MHQMCTHSGCALAPSQARAFIHTHQQKPGYGLVSWKHRFQKVCARNFDCISEVVALLRE